MANGRLPMRTVATVEPLLQRWPWASTRLLRDMVNKYGMPHQATERGVVWYYNDPWQRTIVWREGAYHNFPRPHLDLVEQTLRYRLPTAKLDEIKAFSDSIVINRRTGELTVCCANEAMNFVTVNLVNEIAIGALTAAKAKERQIEIMRGLRLRWPEPEAEGLQFTVMEAATGTQESGEVAYKAF